MFERPSTFNRFAVAYSCSFVRFEPLHAAFLAREPPALAVVRAPPAALRAESPAVFRVPLAALRTEPAAAFRVPLTAFRVPLATFRAEPEALAVPLLAASFARAVPLL